MSGRQVYRTLSAEEIDALRESMKLADGDAVEVTDLEEQSKNPTGPNLYRFEVTPHSSPEGSSIPSVKLTVVNKESFRTVETTVEGGYDDTDNPNEIP